MTGLGNIDDVYKHYLKVIDENQQLKELLRECRKALKKAKGDTVWYPVEIDHTLTQIDNAIGERND